MMEAGPSVQAELEFRGAEFSVRVSSGAELLEVEVSDMLSADQWRGQFDSAYIEDLTRKTGNFKQFAIFCTMLESALTKSSESVTLDLLTYSDLELLRSRKAGLGSRPRPAAKSPALNAKRYLILIYSVEFDRIHYPLPLPYQGKPDPARLQREIRELREELRERGEGAVHTSKDSETHRLRAELAKLRQEKEVLAGALERMQAEGSRPHSDPRGVRVLKDVVHSLEEELLRERTRNKRAQSKREQEYRQLQEQLEELKESERSLRVRVKSLTNELALCRKGRMTPLQRSGSSLSRGGGEGEGRRSVSQERERSQGRAGSAGPVRSVSRERRERWAGGDRERSRERSGSTGPRPVPPRVSPSGTRVPRFDPTAYVKDKEQRQREAERRSQRKVRRDLLATPPSSERGRPRSRETRPLGRRVGSVGRGRSSSVESARSRRSSASSLAELEELAQPLPSSAGLGGRKAGRPLGSVLWNAPGLPRRGSRGPKKRMSSTPTRKNRSSDKENSFGPGADLSEIDARLQALQEYMRNLDTRA
ncbi:centrosomal protein CCDC61-like isoform X1 [Acipenser ruthenus]|uniref:centrosomal protein CCDC61-like isoform X1 n=1 Tax=Acipenser ruthenus TaxID=7906 RepID=UPI0027413AFE|nr:centrosomal protein CCDC61-like isoform X1 [Acipenser ruthenus]